jgi:osmotically-inducible protein OsmY
VEVSVDSGVVTLTGSVDAFWKKTLAEEISQSLGVVRVVNKLSVVPGMDMNDEKIAGDIVNAIDRNLHVDAGSVNVKVHQGDVTLSGKVPNWMGYRSAYEAALFTRGVREVDSSNLVIASEA